MKLRYLTRAIGMLGLLLALLHLSGIFAAPHQALAVLPENSRVKNYYERSLSFTEAKEKLTRIVNSKPILNQDTAQAIFQIISGSFAHGESYIITPKDDWLLWIYAQFQDTFTHDRYLDAQDPELLLRKGAGFCHQSSLLLLHYLRAVGFEAVLVRLGGHFVVEVLIPNLGRNVLDPDHGIYWSNNLEDFGSKLSKDDVVKKVVENGFSQAVASKMAEIYISQEDNTRSLYYDPKALNLQIETRKWSYLVPLILCLISLLFELFSARSKQKLT
ncbi:MAG: transglutaminase domain-containing protein [Deltaproteobacteria bacterium]|nr:transglutaminase domain-containing protein [Deltaproteobacteria bacterium]